MKKISFYFMLLTCGMFLFSSCSKDDDGDDVGTIEMTDAKGQILSTDWQYTKAVARRSGLNPENFRITLFSDAGITDLCEHSAVGGYIELDVPRTVGTHNIGLISTLLYAYKTPAGDYVQPISGKITITSITETTVEGSFEAVYEKDGVVEIDAKGKFTSTICGSLDGPTFIDQTLQGIIDKTDWFYSNAIVSMNSSGSYDFTIEGNDENYSIKLKYVPAAVGVYVPGYSDGHFTIDIKCPSHEYGKTFAGEGVGKIEIVSITDTDVEAKIWLIDAETTELMDVNGDFTASFE